MIRPGTKGNTIADFVRTEYDVQSRKNRHRPNLLDDDARFHIAAEMMENIADGVVLKPVIPKRHHMLRWDDIRKAMIVAVTEEFDNTYVRTDPMYAMIDELYTKAIIWLEMATEEVIDGTVCLVLQDIWRVACREFADIIEGRVSISTEMRMKFDSLAATYEQLIEDSDRYREKMNTWDD